MTNKKTAEELELENQQQQEVIEGMLEKMEELEASPKASQTIVKHDGKKYMVTAPAFTADGVAYTAQDLKGNKELVAALVSIESGILKLIE